MAVGFLDKDTEKEEIPLVPVKFTHALCVGQTGSGKTTGFIYPNLQNRMELDHGLLIFDIKGNEHRAIKHLAEKAGRIDDVIKINKPWGKKINAIEKMNERQFETLLTNLLGEISEAGKNVYFTNGAINLGMNIFNILRKYVLLDKEINDEHKGKLVSVYGDIDLKYEKISLMSIYKASLSRNSVFYFIKTLEENINKINNYIKSEIINDVREKQNSTDSMVFKNIVLNYNYLKQMLNTLEPYNKSEEDDIEDRSNISAIIQTLHNGLGFMGSLSSSYISSTIDTFDIVNALQEKKIIILNVRVIPNFILEIILNNIFDDLISLNLKEEKSRQPVSIFIDEAQRIINKDIPLDVLRSSKVDVIMAVQSVSQLISKFQGAVHWNQLSVNLSYKVAFKSPIIQESSESFFVDTDRLDTFEYAKEFDNNTYLSKPIFLDDTPLKVSDFKYQKNTLKINYIENLEFLEYDVQHYENERELIVKNITSNEIRYQKIFSESEKQIIDGIIDEFRRKIAPKVLN